jgi:DNA polymerase III epsilon subunit-like protein
MSRVNEFRGDLPMVGHNSGFDSTFLQKHIEGFPGVPLYDTLELSRIVAPGFKSYKLTDLARELGVAVSEAHRAYDDAEVSGVIFALLQAIIPEMSERNRRAVRDLLGPGWVARHMFAPVPPVFGASAQLSLFDEPVARATAVSCTQPAETKTPQIPASLEEPLLAALSETRGAGWVSAPATPECAATVAG